MSDKVLTKKIAELEFQQDQLLAELEYVDTLLRAVGFSEGLQTVKATALDMIEMGDQ